MAAAAGEAVDLPGALQDVRSPIHSDALLDALEALHYECKITPHKRLPTTEAFLKKYDDIVTSVRTSRPNKDEFDVIRVLGRGGFGEVQLARHKKTQAVYAVKMLSKCEMINKKETAFFWEEREIMTLSDSDWIVKMHMSFQDDQYLYMVMEYMAGGDLESLAENFDISAESWAQFYTAELVLAIDAIHSMGYVHRDIKPGNVLLDSKGHVKLADFGTCCKLDAKGKIRSNVAVGTPDYISPEVLESQGGGSYTKTCDFWALGVTLYEMVCGDLPFFCDTLLGTYAKIQSHQPENLPFVDAEEAPVDISDNCKDILRKLICHKTDRLGNGGIDEIKGHAWFAETDFSSLRNKTPPVVPELTSLEDATNFGEVEAPIQPIELFKEARKFEGYHLPFIGFSYCNPSLKPKKKSVANESESGPMTIGGLQKQVELLQDTNKKLELEVAALTAEKAEQEAVKAAEEAGGEADISTISQVSAKEIQFIEESDKLKKAEVEVETLKAKCSAIIDQHKVELSSIKGELEEARADAEHTSNKNSKLDKNLSEAKKKADELQVEVEQISNQLKDEQAVVMKLKEDASKLDAEASDKTAVESDLKKKFDRANAAKDRAELEVDELKDKIRKLERGAARDEESRIELQDYNTSLLKQMSDIKIKLNVADVSKRDLEDEMAIMEAKLKAAKRSASGGSKGIPEGEIAQDVLELPRMTSPTATELKKLRDSFCELEATQEKVTREADERLETEKNLKRELMTKLNHANEEIESLKSENKTISLKLSEEVENNVDLANELCDRDDTMSALEAELSSKSNKLVDVEQQLSMLDAKYQSLDLKSSEQEVQLKKLEDELTKNASGSVSEEQMSKAKNLIDKAQTTIAENVQQLLEYEKQISRLTLDNERQAAELRVIREEKAKITTKTGSSMALLKHLSSSQAIDLAVKKTDYEAQIRELEQKLEVKEAEHKALIEQHQADLKHQQKLSHDAMRRQPSVRATRKVSSDRSATKDLEPDSRRIIKQNKQLEQQVRQLAMKLDEALLAHKSDLDRLTEDFRVKDEELREDFRIKEEAYLEQIKHFKESLDRKSSDHQKMARSVNRITQLYDRELRVNPLNVMSPPMQMIQKSLKEGTFIEGVLMKPKSKNMKKHGWETFFCTADSDQLSIKSGADIGGKPIEIFKISDMHNARSVSKEEVIHAKPHEVERIFKLVCVEMQAPEKMEWPDNAVHDVLELDTGNNVISFRGHIFEKSLSKKAELCSVCRKATQGHSLTVSSTAKNRGYQCRACKRPTHYKHIKENDKSLGDCPGTIEPKEILFMAEDAADAQRWISHLSNLIVQRGTAALALKFNDDAPICPSATPDDGAGTPLPMGEDDDGFLDISSSSPDPLGDALHNAKRLSEDLDS